MYSVLWISILLGLSVAVIESHDDAQALCTYSISHNVHQHNHTSGNFLDANNTQHCSKPTDACFILWIEDPKNKSITIFTQGCWDGNDPNCKRNECIAVKKPTAIRNTSFCCCMGNFCNSNITDGYLIDATEISSENPARETVIHLSYTMQVIIAVVGTMALVCILIASYYISNNCWPNPKRSNESLNLIEAPPPIPPTFDLDTLKIQKESIGQGSFGSVYPGSLNDRTVAVKIFPFNNRQFFYNERDIYLLPHMKHPSIPEYIGCQERTNEDERQEFLLVLSYCPLGCLQNYLKERTVDWNQLHKMSLSIVNGLAHLHTEILKDEKHKHCIAHRDLTSRNILIKADGACMLCDFGFALQVSGSKYFHNGQEGQAEADSLTEVGTLRYKAPELLEGSVNLRDLESSLKQIDIYALGLILWEIATRCSELCQGSEVPSYKLPFEAEVGAHATPEQIKNIVVMHKARPLFPDIWKATNPVITALKDTIDDCWDQDAEARLTALCVEQRLLDMGNQWKRSKAESGGPGSILPSPTLISNFHKSCNLIKKSSNEINVDCCDSDHFICPRERANSLSECTTETLLSPSTEVVNGKNLINSYSPPAKMTVPVQPYQGRNPCLARNLIQQQNDDLPIIGNSLIDCPSKYDSNKKFYSLSDGDTVLSVPCVGLEHSVSNIARISHSIPYVQNQVNTIPKKTNLNGTNVSKDFWNRITGYLVSLNHKTSSNCNLPEEQQLLKNSTISSPLSPTDDDGKQGQTNPMNSFWICNDAKEGNAFPVNSDNTSMPNDSIPNCKLVDNNITNENAVIFPITKDDPFLNGNYDDKKSENSCASLNDVTNETVPCSDKSKRPTTLPVQFIKNGHDVEGDPIDVSDTDISKEIDIETAPQVEKSKVVRRSSGGRRKGVKRVQTPYEIAGRFSLIDDRIMSSQDLPVSGEAGASHSGFENVKSSASVPNMNLLCSIQATNRLQLEKKEQTELKEVLKSKPLNGLIVPVSNNGQQNVLIV